MKARTFFCIIFVLVALTCPSSATAGWFSGLGDPNDPNALTVWAGAGDESNLGRLGAVLWPFELGIEYAHYTPGTNSLDQLGVYALVHDIGAWVLGVFDFSQAMAQLPEPVQPTFYGGGFLASDLQFEGYSLGPCLGLTVGAFFAEYRWPTTAGDVSRLFDETPKFIAGARIEF